jgi:sulfite exporter TauE/SafE
MSKPEMPNWNFSFGVLIGWMACNLVYLVAFNANPMAVADTPLAFVAFVVTFIQTALAFVAFVAAFVFTFTQRNPIK